MVPEYRYAVAADLRLVQVPKLLVPRLPEALAPRLLEARAPTLLAALKVTVLPQLVAAPREPPRELECWRLPERLM